MKKILILMLKFLLCCCCVVFSAAAISPVNKIYPRVLSKFQHDPDAFTQGLEYRNGKLYESTGMYDKSSIRVLDTTGKILKKFSVPGVFAEGCTVFNNKLYQLTWRENQCLVYSFPGLEIQRAYSYTGEGWGLTNDSKLLIMSNGSDTLYYRDSALVIKKKISVKINGTGLKNLNELEYARNHIFANVWFDNNIYEIDPLTGNVVRVIDCSEMTKQEMVRTDQDVLNGIAYDMSADNFFITGKNWRHIYIAKIPH